MTTKLQNLQQRINELKGQKASLISELRDLLNTWQELTLTAKELSRIISEEREKLYEKIEVAKSTNATKKEIYSRLSVVKERIKGLRRMINQLKREVKEPEETVLQRLNRLEWLLETKPNNREEEKRIVNSIRRLEGMRLKWKKINQLRNQLIALEQEREELRQALEKGIAEKMELNPVIDELKQSLNSKIEKRKQISKEIDKIKEKMDEVRIKVEQISKELTALEEERKNMIRDKRMLREEERKRKELMIMKNIVEYAKEKLKKGEKLTFYEFKLLMGGEEAGLEE